MNSRCGLIEVDLVMEPPAQPPIRAAPATPAASSLQSEHHGLAQSQQDLLETGSTFLGPKVGAPLCEELEGAARGTRRSMDVRASLEKEAVLRGAAWAFNITP